MMAAILTNRRLMLAAVMAAAATGGAFGQQPTASPAESGFPLLASEALQLVAAGESIAMVTESSMGTTMLSVRRVRTGTELIRRDGVDARRIAFNGRHVAFRVDLDVRIIDLETRTESTAWRAARGDAGPLCASPSRLLIAVRHDDRVALVVAPFDEPDSTTELPLPISADAFGQLRLLCSESTAVIATADDTAFIWRAPDTIAPFDLDGRQPIAVTGDFLYALAPDSSLTRHPLAGAASWDALYSPKGRLLPRAVPGPDMTVIRCVQLRDSGAADLVSISTLDGSSDVTELPNRAWDQLLLWNLSPDVLVSIGRRDGRGWIYTLPLTADAPSTATPSMSSTPSTTSEGAAAPIGADAGQRALAWLDRQLGPPFVSRFNVEARLIDSYEDDKRAGWTYDAAIAAVAFTAWGRIDEARQLLAGLEHIQHDDGSWEFAYDPDRAVGVAGQRYIGAMAWAVIAANFFESDTGDRSFERMAETGLQFIERFLVRDAASPLDGGVSMGPAAPLVFSTEHNADAMAAFLWRGRLSGRQDHVETASKLRDFLFRVLAVESSDPPAFWFKVGARDASLYLDAQTWTTLALAGFEADPRLARALAHAESTLRVGSGHRNLVTHVAGFRDAETAAIEKVWSEGTEGMVAARFALGDDTAARLYHQETARLQTASGGIPYATENTDGWTTDPSVAGTAWFLVNDASPRRNPFAPAIVR